MNTQITVTTPLPPHALRAESVDFSGGLSQLGEMTLELLSGQADLDANALLGRPIAVTIARDRDADQHFHGYVTRFSLGASRGRHFGYQAVVRPWLWFLTRTADCRVFQSLDVPAIVRQVFDDNGFSDFDFRLFRTYRQRVYCVQYRESDFSFVARLLEDEGICWYFEHAASRHTLVLTDSTSAHEPIDGEARLPFFENLRSVPPDLEFVSRWQVAREVRTGRTALRSYDFERPAVDLGVEAALARPHAMADLERFDHQGDYLVREDGEQMAEDGLEAHQALHHQVQGLSNCHRLAVGRLFKLDRHPRETENTEYLLTSMTLRARIAGLESGQSEGRYECEFTGIPGDCQFRPPRHTRRPVVQGPQSAVVVGPAGDEIHTDKYGRVKVQFHWDRLGQRDDKSSCWVRVSHPWAGKGFGVMHVPRIGQEVIVSFLEGDPDQPLITGRVHNAEQMPPWELPANATQSGILTRSSPGGAGDNANAIRFEDKKGAEQLWIHAEKNQDIEVENDETHWVGHDRRKTIDHDETVLVKNDRTETVGRHETITIGVNRTEAVGANERITIGANRQEVVAANETITIGANRTEAVAANETITIGANRTISVAASETATVALQRTHTVGVNETIAIGAAQEVAIGAMQSITVGATQVNAIGADRSLDVGGAQATTVGKGRTTGIGHDDTLDVGKTLVITAGDAITLKTGDASIVLKKDGSIVITGRDITLEGSGKINLKAGGDIVMKGSKIHQN